MSHAAGAIALMQPAASRSRYLMLCHDYDAAAFWLHERLSAVDGLDGELIRASDLDLARAWTHRLGDDHSSLAIELANGRILRGEAFDGVLNRLITAPGSLARFAADEDRDYADAEAIAFAMSWLAALPHVLNPPTPQGLSGAWRHITEWLVFAGRAGLATPAYRQTENDPFAMGHGSLAPADKSRVSILVLDDELFGEPPGAEIGAACRRLAKLAGDEIISVDLFEATPGRWLFAHASSWPDLRIGGEPLVRALARRLGAGPG